MWTIEDKSGLGSGHMWMQSQKAAQMEAFRSRKLHQKWIPKQNQVQTPSKPAHLSRLKPGEKHYPWKHRTGTAVTQPR